MLDAALPAADLSAVKAVLDRYRADGDIEFHALRTRESGRRRFVYVHVLVPDEWSVKRAHDVAQRLEVDIAAALPDTTTFTHIEPRHDPKSYGHLGLPEPVPVPDDL